MDFAGWAKRMGELQIHAYKVQHGLENFAVVRLPNVYGPGIILILRMQWLLLL